MSATTPSARHSPGEAGAFSRGRVVAGFEILDELGRGSRTVAYRVRRGAEHYALKVPDEAVWGEQAERAFRREAALLACVGHPGLARVHEVGTHEGRPYIVMDLLEGRLLTDVLSRGALPIEQAVAVGIDVAETLAASHRAGLVHRDVKPDNLVLGPDGRTRVLDLSLATRTGETPASAAVGTMLYCAPEQAGMLHRPVDGRADLYSLGAVLHECLTGAPPFESDDVGELLRRHATTPAPDVRAARPEVPAVLAAIVATLLAKDPDDRYQSGAALAADLRQVAERPADDTIALRTTDRGSPRLSARLVGRDAEVAELAARWDRARAGHGGAALILGPPGGGKSRLARAVVADAERAGAVVLAGKLDPDSSEPLAPIRKAIDAHVERALALPAEARSAALERLIAAAGPAAAPLRRLSPALATVLDAPELVDDGSDQRLAGAVTAFLTALARSSGGGLILFLDDVQWLDDATRRVLHELADELASAPLLVLATARDDARSADGVTALRSGLGDVLDLTVTLGPLASDAVAELVSSMTGRLHVDEDTAARLAARSDGNPLALEEYVDALIDAGLLVPHWGTWHVDAEGLHHIDLPTDAVALILKRLERLDPDTRFQLGVGALVGATFDAATVAEVCGTDVGRVREATTAGTWQHLVERRDGDRYGFLHDRIREALIAQFPTSEQAELHDRVADVLDGQPPGPTTIYALAWHCLQGDAARRPDRTFRACREAARQALADQAPEDALTFLAGARVAAERAGIEADADLLHLVGLAQFRLGRCDDALVSLDMALALTDEPTERARILALTVMVHDATWNTSDQAATAEHALAELGHPFPRDKRAVASTAGLLAAGLAIGATGIGRGTSDPARREEYRLRAALGFAAQLAYTRELQPTRALSYALRDAYVISRLGSGPEVARSLVGWGHLAQVIGLKRTARRLTTRARREAAATGDPRVGAYVEWLDGVDRYFFGIDHGEQARHMYGEQQRWLDFGAAHDVVLMLLCDALLRGDTADVNELVAERKALLRGKTQAGRMATHMSDAQILARQGRLADALRYLDDMRAEPDLLVWKLVDILLAELMVAVEHDDVGERFDAAVAELEALDLRPLDLVPPQRALYVHLAAGQISRYRNAPEDERAVREAEARSALRALGKAADTDVLRAHHAVSRAALLEASRRPEAALRELARAEPALRAVDAPLIALEVARLRALALRAVGADGEAGRQGRYAVALASENGWPHRSRRLAAELDVPSTRPVRAAGTVQGEDAAGGVYRQRLEAIEQVSRAATRVVDPNRLAALALDETIRILGAERAFLFLRDERTDELVPFAGRDATGGDLSELTGYSTTLVERVNQDGEALVVTGTDEGEALGAESVVLHGLRSIMVAPIMLDGRVVGVAYLDSRVAKGIFTVDDVGTLVAIVNHVAVAFETARAAQLEAAVAAANDRRDVAETMRDGLAALTGNLEPDEILHRLLRTVMGVVGGEHGWMALPGDGPGSPLRILAVDADSARGSDDAGGASEHLSPSDPDLDRLLAATSPLVGGPRDAPSLVRDALGGTGSWLAIPLRSPDEHLGVLVVASHRSRAYGEEKVEVGAALVGQGLVVYGSARLFARVQELAAVDELTGLANRRHFFELATSHVARARRQRAPLTAMMIDVDHFKMVNDRFGHLAGDEVLTEVAARLRSAGRAEDVVGRYGGEEFAVLASESADGAAAAAERLRVAVAETPVLTSAGPISISVSIGVAELEDGDDVSSLLARADRRLYEAKRSGRNRIEGIVR